MSTFCKTKAKKSSVGILCYDEELALFANGATLFSIGPRDDLNAQAHRLFAALREADEHPELTELYAHLPSTEGVGLALYNRCIRAAAHTIKKVT